jgi:hypothetical protein
LLPFSFLSCSLHQHRPNSVSFGFRVPLSALAGFTPTAFCVAFSREAAASFSVLHSQAREPSLDSLSEHAPALSRRHAAQRPRISRRASVAVILLSSCVWKNFLPTSLIAGTPSKHCLSPWVLRPRMRCPFLCFVGRTVPSVSIRGPVPRFNRLSPILRWFVSVLLAAGFESGFSLVQLGLDPVF